MEKIFLQKNIMTVDLEDYFCDLNFAEWPKYESKIVKTTSTLLDLFRKYNMTATFFTLGYIAEKFPELIEMIVKDGHEIASHSYAHLDIRKLTREEFDTDLVKSLNVLEKITGEKVLGFRAPFFSVDQNTLWAIEIIRKYLKYDSSIFPTKTPLYGIPTAPRKIYKPSRNDPLKNDDTSTLLELPPATYDLPVIGNLPIAGGFHLRFLPYCIIKAGIRKINKGGNPAICYIHPKDLDREMPHLKQYKWYYYYGLNGAKTKYEKLLHDFKFESVRDVINI